MNDLLMLRATSWTIMTGGREQGEKVVALVLVGKGYRSGPLTVLGVEKIYVAGKADGPIPNRIV